MDRNATHIGFLFLFAQSEKVKFCTIYKNLRRRGEKRVEERVEERIKQNNQYDSKWTMCGTLF